MACTTNYRKTKSKWETDDGFGPGDRVRPGWILREVKCVRHLCAGAVRSTAGRTKHVDEVATSETVCTEYGRLHAAVAAPHGRTCSLHARALLGGAHIDTPTTTVGQSLVYTKQAAAHPVAPCGASSAATGRRAVCQDSPCRAPASGQHQEPSAQCWPG